MSQSAAGASPLQPGTVDMPSGRPEGTAAMGPPEPLAPAEKTTTSGSRPDMDIEHFLCQRAENKQIPRRTRWTVLQFDDVEEDTSALYDTVWAALGKDGKRWLSVAKHCGVTRALLHKGDDGEADVTNLPATLYDVRDLTAGGPAARKATADFARAWLDQAQEATSNFEVETEQEERVAALRAFEDSQGLTNKEFLLSLAAAKLNGNTARAQVLKKISPELKSYRIEDKRQQKAREEIRHDPCYRSAETADGLHMPTDFVNVDSWLGRTWRPETGAESMTYLHYLNSKEHLERTAVLFSDAGSGKTAVLHATARTLALRYQEDDPYYLCAGNVNGLRSADRKGLLKQGAPRIIEDYAPRGNPNGGRQPLEEYLVNLLNVKDGGTIDTPGGHQMNLPAATPQLISTNRDFDHWIGKFRNFPPELQHAVSKRVVFFTLPNTPLVREEKRKRRQADMASMVAAGLEREQKFLRDYGGEDASTATTPSEVPGSPSPSDPRSDAS